MKTREPTRAPRIGAGEPTSATSVYAAMQICHLPKTSCTTALRHDHAMHPVLAALYAPHGWLATGWLCVRIRQPSLRLCLRQSFSLPTSLILGLKHACSQPHASHRIEYGRGHCARLKTLHSHDLHHASVRMCRCHRVLDTTEKTSVCGIASISHAKAAATMQGTHGFMN